MVSPVGRLLPPGERHFGKYELVAKIATGGMAEIFLARPHGAADDDSLVIKRVLPHLAEDDRFLAMFRDEARLALRIVHPNVCRVLEAGTVGHTYFIAMEYLHGVPLSQVLLATARAGRELDLRLIAAMIQQSCAGLHHAHELEAGGDHLGVVHRDVSPPNIFVTADGTTKLLDFGVAKARGASQKTRTGTVKGKNSYMSPEQILGKDVDRRSDVFSLGVVMWEALTARRLFARETDFLTFRAITDDPIPSPSEYRGELPLALDAVVARALARDRDDRFASAAAMADAIGEAMADHGGVATADELGAFIEAEFAPALASQAALHERATTKFAALDPPTMDLVVEEILGDDSLPGDHAPATKRAVTDTDELVRHRSSRPALVVAAIVGAGIAVIAVALFAGGDAQELAVEPEAPPIAAPERAPAPRPAEPAPRRDLAEDRGYLTVDAMPRSAVFVDGEKVGVTPLRDLELEPGVHQLVLVADDGRKRRERLRIRAGRTTNLGRLVWTKR